MTNAIFILKSLLGIIHTDHKLANVLLAKFESMEPPNDLVLRFPVDNVVFALHMAHDSILIAKLPDFETAIVWDSHCPVSSEIFYKNVTGAQFCTTWEYIPIDYFLLGYAAEQGHHHDQYQLGMTMFHLYSGIDIWNFFQTNGNTCFIPDDFQESLQSTWATNIRKRYSVNRGVCKGEEEDELEEDEQEESEDENFKIFGNALYRYFVLFGLSTLPAIEILRIRPILDVVKKWQGNETFEKHHAEFSIDKGTNVGI